MFDKDLEKFLPATPEGMEEYCRKHTQVSLDTYGQAWKIITRLEYDEKGFLIIAGITQL